MGWERRVHSPPVSVSLLYWRIGYSGRQRLPSASGTPMTNALTTVLGTQQMPEATPTPKPRVLVADDEQVIANTLAIILNQAGFEARAVYSGEKAIEALDTFEPDMLISDVIMTGMTGIEAAIATRAKMPNCKILLFSGQAATADLLEKARAQGHEFEILAKPVHPTDLLAKLRRQS
jgi:CheY-like chemotaxis protein